MTRYLMILALAGAFGCTKISKHTPVMSAQLTADIAEAKRFDNDLIDEYIRIRRLFAEEVMNSTIIPAMIINFMEESAVKEAFENVVCNENGGKMDRALVMRDAVDDLSFVIDQERRKRNKAINAVARDLRASVRNHYDPMERKSRAITAHVQSVVKGLDLEGEIREALSRPLRDTSAFKKASKGLDKALKYVR